MKGKYEYVISTHTDRGHIHNHIIICGVNFENGLSFGTEHDRKNNPAWKQLRKISDDICLENKLSVIAMPESYFYRVPCNSGRKVQEYLYYTDS
ncbi:MAG: relaxase/mobilization nuclease domain-containing protein [Oscillospiraceae bacterium]|nr:relaxase/mobilization nuclease domain-containing protein [Oscillospiraceae bacterium]